jgi:hypothetical protein
MSEQFVQDLSEAKAWAKDPDTKLGCEIQNIVTVAGKTFRQNISLANEIENVLKACFPALESRDDAVATIENSLGFHDIDATDWLLYRAENGCLLGLAALIKLHNGVLNHNFCVLPSHRQLGIGLDLLEALCIYAVGLGFDRVIGLTESQSNFTLVITHFPSSIPLFTDTFHRPSVFIS